MANYTSKYTGVEIDLAVASGSSATGVIRDFNTLSGSSISTLTIGGNTTLGNAGGDIHHFRGIITASNKIFGLDEIHLLDGTVSGDTLVKAYASSDDGVVDIYANNSVVNRIHGNGLSYFNGGNVVIGTTVSASNAKLTVRGNISASGQITASREITVLGQGNTGFLLKDGALGGDTLVKIYDSVDDGVIDVYRDNHVMHRLHGNGHSFISGSHGLSIGSAVSASNVKLTVVGHISASAGISASGKIASRDEFVLIDGSDDNDTLVRMYDSDDDGIIDVYQSNAVKTSLKGNGVSYFDGGNVAIGGTAAPNKLTVYGHISASQGGITGSRIASVDEIYLKDGVLGGDTLVRVYASSDDGIIDVYANNAVKNRIAGNTTSYFNGGNVAVGATSAGAKLTVAGAISASGGITSSGKVVSADEIHLKDGTLAGDTLVRQYASGDDGIIDVYQNNAVKNRINGNGLSYFNGGDVAIGAAVSASNVKLTVRGAISASGGITSSGIISAEHLHSSDDAQIVGTLTVGSISATSINTTNITSSIITSSIVHASGSNVFGDAATDTHTFNGNVTASNKIFGLDEIHLLDGTLAGDTLVKAYASGDDGIIDVYQNNAVKSRIHGNGTSYVEGSFVVAGQQKAANMELTVNGDISASGKIYGNGGVNEFGGNISGSSTSTLTLGGDITANDLIVNQITASGNISSSGTITGNAISLGTGENGLVNAAGGRLQISSSNDIIFDCGDDYLFKSEGTQIVQIKGDEAILDVNGALDVSGNTILGDALTDTHTISGHITASGNISSSGAITATGNIQGGNLLTEHNITHVGDSDTQIVMEPNLINLLAGGKSAIKLETSTGKIQLNNTNDNLDLQVMADNGTTILHTDATLNSVGINTTTPITGSTAGLTVEGGISASGVIEGHHRTKVITAAANLPLHESSSGALIIASGSAITMELPHVASGSGVSFTVLAGIAGQHIITASNQAGTIQNQKKIYGHITGTSADGAGASLVAAAHKITLNSNNQIGDRVVIVGDGINWYVDGILKDAPTIAT